MYNVSVQMGISMGLTLPTCNGLVCRNLFWRSWTEQKAIVLIVRNCFKLIQGYAPCVKELFLLPQLCICHLPFHRGPSVFVSRPAL